MASPALTRVPLLVAGMISLVAGTLAGLARLSWEVPAVAATASPWHGALMICTFLGTVIGLERAVALGRPWAYLAPAVAGFGGLAALVGAPPAALHFLLVAAATALTAASVQAWRRTPAPFTVVLAGGALCWLVGNLVWAVGADLVPAVPWWLAFLVLTIAGERLELTRLLPIPAAARRLFAVVAAAIVLGAAVSLGAPSAGLTLFSAGLLALAVWLLRYDLARRNARQQGLTRFIALCLLSGYSWLVLAGLLGLAGGFAPGHPWRDAALHAVGLGFVFAMIFGHAPIIFPAVARVKIPYHPAFYLPLLLLHASLAWRVAGTLVEDFAWRRHGGLANAVTLALFVATMIASVARGAAERKAGAAAP